MSVPADRTEVLHSCAALDVARRDIGPVTVLVVSGEVDLLTGPRFAAYTRAQLEARPPRLVVDLTGVTFFGSHGMATLVALAEAARADGGPSFHVVVGGNRMVGRTLQIAGLTRIIDVRDDLTDLVDLPEETSSGLVDRPEESTSPPEVSTSPAVNPGTVP